MTVCYMKCELCCPGADVSKIYVAETRVDLIYGGRPSSVRVKDGILLAEVGKLRDEKRALQLSIAELISIKAKHSADGVYAPGWRPPVRPFPSSALPRIRISLTRPPSPRKKHPRRRSPRPRSAPRRRHHQNQQQLALRAAPTPPSAPPAPGPAMPVPNLRAWAQWRSNPLLAPGAPEAPSPAVEPAPPPRSGLFGPKTPPRNNRSSAPCT
ncbi:hypothetical protein FB451DRAFT_1408492 [Mycena latifolia]|nr:hypothetical protein FB451DRAFT_1408492 [Mycena latifolia]